MKIKLAIILLFSSNAHADLQTQMEKVLGDWSFNSNAIIRIQQQSATDVKIYVCDPHIYFSTPERVCKYNRIEIFAFRSDLDAFFMPSSDQGLHCSESLQVSIQYQNELVHAFNPYHVLEGCHVNGLVEEATRVKVSL